MITDIRQIMQAMQSAPGIMFKPVSKSSGEEPQTIIFESDDLEMEYDEEDNTSVGSAALSVPIEIIEAWDLHKALITIDDNYVLDCCIRVDMDEDNEDEDPDPYAAFTGMFSTSDQQLASMVNGAVGNDEGAGYLEISISNLELSGQHSIKVGITESPAYEGVYSYGYTYEGSAEYPVCVFEADVESNPKRFNTEESEITSIVATANGVVIPVEEFDIDPYSGVCTIAFECPEFYQAVAAGQPTSIKLTDADSKVIEWNNLPYNKYKMDENEFLYLYGYLIML